MRSNRWLGLPNYLTIFHVVFKRPECLLCVRINVELRLVFEALTGRLCVLEFSATDGLRVIAYFGRFRKIH